ncbi:MAG: hypothetical protein KDI92_02950, partial [Xanthomonadales bacterium]|nr:hypothetical protein [Xanthomonadales bacterium]
LLDVSSNGMKAQKLTEFLDIHKIRYGVLSADKIIKDHRYPKNQAIYIGLDQPQTTLIQSLFNTDTSFTDNTFYDVSAWHLAMAWGLPWAAVSSPLNTHELSFGNKPQNIYKKNAIAYMFDWSSGNAPAALNYLNQQFENVMITGKALHIDGAKVPAGSFVLPVAKNTSEDKLFAVLSTITDAFKVNWYAIDTAQAETGVDLGSPALQRLQPVKVLMVVGSGIDAYQAGSLWHLFDTQVYLPLTKVRTSQLMNVDLNDYSHIILPNGSYERYFDEQLSSKIKSWVAAGGHLIAIQAAANWVEKTLQKIEEDKEKTEEKVEVVRKPYEDYNKDAAEKVLGGAIVEANVDLSHPLALGTDLKNQFVMMKGDAVLRASEQAYNMPMQITEQVRAAGFISDYWQKKLSKAPLVIVDKVGKGSIIKFGFNPNFRAYWLGTQRWIINAVFLTDLIQKTK